MLCDLESSLRARSGSLKWVASLAWAGWLLVQVLVLVLVLFVCEVWVDGDGGG